MYTVCNNDHKSLPNREAAPEYQTPKCFDCKTLINMSAILHVLIRA